MKIYNSLTGKKETLETLEPNRVKMYVCGMTVYDHTHIGHARTFLCFDVIVRYLRHAGFTVDYIRNITDVDDKIIERSKKLDIEALELTSKYIDSMQYDFNSLGMIDPDQEPKATENIPSIIKLIKKLIEKNHAYIGKSDVYFSTDSFAEYGRLSRRNTEEMLAGARVNVDEEKRNPADFVLWKQAEQGLAWDSPWGKGRPGWHIECSAMSMDALGESFDIHGGGMDLKFPHHENEIAQSCCNNSTEKFSNYWVHNGFVTINKEKMSKSLGNIVSISDAVDKYSGQVVRLALLSAHYSQPLDWNEKLLEEQKSIIEKWYQMYDETNEDISLDIIETLLDDLNSPGFIAKIHELYVSAKKGDEQSKKSFNSACKLIGLFNLNKDEWEEFKKIKIEISETFILKKINDRLIAKQKGDFKLADQIRNELLSKGIVIEDQKDKTIWKLK